MQVRDHPTQLGEGVALPAGVLGGAFPDVGVAEQRSRHLRKHLAPLGRVALEEVAGQPALATQEPLSLVLKKTSSSTSLAVAS